MSELMSIVREIGSAILASFVPMTVATAMVLAVALVLDRVLARRVAASLRLWLYVAVAVRAAVPAGWQSPLGLLGRRAPAATIAGAPVALTGDVITAAPSTAGAAFWVGLAWALVSLVLLSRWVWLRIALARHQRVARPARDEIAALAPSATIVEHPTMGPLLAGIFRPRIVIPRALAEGGVTETLRCVLRHELAHVARHDQLVTAALQLASIAAWPLVPLWVASMRVRALIELAADERALEGSGVTARRQYGEVLVLLADGDLGESRFAFVPSFGAGLPARVRALGFSRRWPLALQATLVALVAATVFACTGEQEPQPPATAPGLTGPTGSNNASPSGPKLPDVIPGQAVVRGSLDKEIIRRVIRRHINEVKYCYEQGQVSNPGLGGRVMVEFTIAATGQVDSSKLQQSTLGNPSVESCIVTAVRRWEFPKPLGGGIVIVSYPFVLTPAPR